MTAAIPNTAPHLRLRRTVAALVGALLAPALLLASTPAVAAEHPLSVSTDGVTFSDGNLLPLFQAMGRVVPGDEYTESVWVRNDASTAGRLRVDLVDPATDSPPLAAGFTLSVAHTPGETVTPVSLDRSIANGACTVLRDEIVLQPGEVARLDLTAAVSAGIVAQNGVLGTVSFRLRGVLSDAAVPGALDPGAPCNADEPDVPEPKPVPDGSLTVTGGGSLAPLVAIGVLAIGGGVIIGLLAWRRRRREQDAQSPGEQDAQSPGEQEHTGGE